MDNKYEYVNHPSHYNSYDVEVIDMMIKIWGYEEAISFCKLSAFKYKMRVGTKPTESIEQDLKKEQWYLDKMRKLQKIIQPVNKPTPKLAIDYNAQIKEAEFQRFMADLFHTADDDIPLTLEESNRMIIDTMKNN